MKVPRVIILHAPGTNRDREAALACELAGGKPEIVHINQLVAGERELGDYQMLVVPGGLSYGDDLGAGRLLANDLYHRFRADLDDFVAAGKPVLGICNGFQALVKAGYLPGSAPVQRVTLTHNRSGHFECRWVRLRPLVESRCLFTRGLEEDILCPVAHGEGRLAVPDESTREALWQEGLVSLTYAAVADGVNTEDTSLSVPVRERAGYPHNPNGSVDDIAGICNEMGNVLGLMPHPEDHVYPHQHPQWSRGRSGGLGLSLIRNGVRAAKQFCE
ncbi:MAG: phosphoribosylformylglycinamidine synthase [Chloroflexi bacterium RBG_13_56_8]|nr:MAG: phosphoribosylformylglycinamidine synthase [Chloroflexi bacterium RBG_13_56_8]